MTASDHIVVTGVASGIGAELRAQLTAQGRRVLGFDLRAAPGISRCDLSDAADIYAAAASIDGFVDGAAMVAGLPGTAPPRAIVAVNLLAVRRLVPLLLPRCRPGSSIVVVSSITAHRCDWPESRIDAVLAGTDSEILDLFGTLSGADAYAASKRLVNRWAEVASAALLGSGVRVNLVSPGPVETPILGDFERSMGADRIRAAAGMVGRHGHPSEVAALLSFLLSPAASWVNGVNIACDGGFSNGRRSQDAPFDPFACARPWEAVQCS